MFLNIIYVFKILYYKFYNFITIALIKEIEIGFKYNNNCFEKIKEFFYLKETIEKRIEEIELFFENNFDEPFVLNFEKGKLKLEKLLTNEPYFINNSKYKIEKEKILNNIDIKNNLNNSLVKSFSNLNNLSKINNSLKNLNNNTNSVKNLNNLSQFSFSPIYLNKKLGNNHIFKDFNRDEEIGNNCEEEKINEDNFDILNKNIYKNKLILRFLKKEKSINNFEKQKEKKEYQKKLENKMKQNKLNTNTNNINNFIDNKNINDYKKIKNNYHRNNNLLNDINSNSNGFESNNFNDKNINFDNYNIITPKNNSSENEEIEKEENSEIKKVKNQLKEVSFKFILNEDEYALLIQERAKNINPMI